MTTMNNTASSSATSTVYSHHADKSTDLTSVASTPELIKLSALEDSKALFVEALVESAVLIIQAIWPDDLQCKNGSKSITTKRFIQETLKRSRASYSTFQVALYYLILLKPIVLANKTSSARLLTCGRRAFLTSLILASKYLQDKNFAISSWSKISGLPVKELRRNELEFLKCVGWKLHIQHEVYNRWSTLLLSSATEDGSVWVSKVENMNSKCEPIFNGEEEENDDDKWQSYLNLEAPTCVANAADIGPLSPEPSDVEDELQQRKAMPVAANTVATAKANTATTAAYLATPATSVIESGSKRNFDDYESDLSLGDHHDSDKKRVCIA